MINYRTEKVIEAVSTVSFPSFDNTMANLKGLHFKHNIKPPLSSSIRIILSCPSCISRLAHSVKAHISSAYLQILLPLLVQFFMYRLSAVHLSLMLIHVPLLKI